MRNRVVGLLWAVVVGAAPASAGAVLVGHPLGDVSTDGTYVVYREAAHSVTVTTAATLASARYPAPGCDGASAASGLVLLACLTPRGFALMRADNGHISVWYGLSSDAASGIQPNDSFFALGKYWALGRRDLGDSTPAIYLNLATGGVTQLDGPRDLNDPSLGGLPAGACGSGQPFALRFAGHLRRVQLVDCRRHRAQLLARCPQRCTGGRVGIFGHVAVWISLDGSRVYARRFSGRRTCHWDVISAERLPTAFALHGHVFINTTTDPSTGASQLRALSLTRC
jgi:hypothetical protein